MGYPNVRGRFVPGIVEGWQQLPPAMIALGERVAARLYAHDPPHEVLLHGDLVPANVILTDDGPKIIDPFGCLGLPGWDLAQLAAAAEARGRRHMLAGLLAGYGSEPPLIAELFAWMILFYLQKNLASGRSEFSEHLWPLAEKLVAVGGAVNFLEHYQDQPHHRGHIWRNTT